MARKHRLTYRPFLVVLAFVILGGVLWATGEPVSSKAVLVGDEEPGETLVVSGTVFGPDGETPRAGVAIYVYNTDINGIYSEDGGNRNPRIKGRLVTNARGHYEFRTVKPGPYPDQRIPAHIHFVLSGGGIREQTTELRFQDDPFISDPAKAAARGRGSFGSIQEPRRGPDGTLRCEFDIRLEG